MSISGRKSDGAIGWVLLTITQMLLGSVVEWAVRSNTWAVLGAAGGAAGTSATRTGCGSVAATIGPSDARPTSTGPPMARTQTATLTATSLFLTLP